ncbi:CPBP family intramembrane glutamic endopeptidase [Anaerolentibacter hominis]|uniref:CPBP family intramembrane glutamic endopeptidase n=1 Tax=Anaerolentibacter hominis TaxID=3079009 RepID=UPI0031B81DB5
MLRRILILFLLCSAIEYTEFLFIKTDQTVLGENVICKLAVIAVIAISLFRQKKGWGDLGFRRTGIFKGMLYGFLLGAVTFFFSYLIEFIVLFSMGRQPHLELFVTNFALTGQNVTGLSAGAFLICIGGNILNVWAEEGLFRGLFFKLGKESCSQTGANFLQALLFGVWHIVMVVQWSAEGQLDMGQALIMAAGYVLLAGILGYEWGLCAALTGTLWTGVFEHFFNNLIGNSLHMVTAGGIDELQILRIVLSNILSLAIVLIFARRKFETKAVSNCL